MHVLFVCTGNTCRSPMAEYMALHMAKAYPQLADSFSASSAGTTALPEMPMSAQSELALQELEVPFSMHSAHRLNKELVAKSDLILAMTDGHLRELLRLYPEAAGRAHTLKGYALGMDGLPAEGMYDISDPFGGPQSAYEHAADEIREALQKVLARLSEV